MKQNDEDMKWEVLKSEYLFREPWLTIRTMLVALCTLPLTLWAQDSLRVVNLLQKGAQQPQDANLIVFYAEELLDIPYVAQTLEVNEEEKLVVNMRQLDCTTYVENCVALTLTTRQGSTSFADYKRNLTTIRYRGGRLNGYPSRNHYFTQWINSNEKLGIVEEVSSPTSLFSATQTISLYYMSDHPASYPMLKNNTEAQNEISKYEQEDSGRTVHYIPRNKLNDTKQGELGAVHDGDILAIVTNKDGLDTSHLGIALWGDDGKLHLLNASQIHKKVVLEPMTLYTYMGKHPTQLGIRVIRMR